MECIKKLNNNQLIELFKTKRVKEIIINEFSKDDWMNLLEKDKSGNLLITLLNEEWCKIMSECNNIKERMWYFFTQSKAHNTLIRKDYFCRFLLDNYKKIELYHILNYQYFSDYVINNNDWKDNPWIIFSFHDEKQLQILKNKNIQIDFIKENLIKFTHENDWNKALQWILNNKIDNIEYNTAIKDFEYLIGYKIRLPKHLITPGLIKKLFDSRNIFEIRLLINKFSINNDETLFNKILHEREKKQLNGINIINWFIPKYIPLIKIFEEYKSDQINNDEFYDKIHDFFEEIAKYSKIDHKFRQLILNEAGELSPDKNIIYEIIKKQNDIELTDIMIDYHFNDISYNVFLDIKQLLNFQLRNGITIPIEHIKIYKNILNLDNLSDINKRKLHNLLQKENVVEMFYDDYVNSRDRMYQEISDSILNKEKLENFTDKDLSEKCWLNVYKFDWQEFFGLVRKSEYTNAKEKTTWSSFSLVWTDCIWVWHEPDSKTFLYEWLDPHQIIHVYPRDSFTTVDFQRWINETSSYKHILKSPSELLKETENYNELFILRKWENETNWYENIWELRPIALYCYDEITPKDIEVAKKENVGIMLIKTESYKKEKSKDLNIFRDTNNEYIHNKYDIKRAIENRDKVSSFNEIDEIYINKNS